VSYTLKITGTTDTKNLEAVISVTILGCQTSYFTLSADSATAISNSQLDSSVSGDIPNTWSTSDS
jgi:hypothetical protein